jgi:uncharacterized protein YheU (UPF0270 family)
MMEDLEAPVQVPIDQISEDALTGIIENFILREGTDYGLVEVMHDTKIKQIRRQIAAGEIKIVFDTKSESVGLMTATDWRKQWK